MKRKNYLKFFLIISIIISISILYYIIIIDNDRVESSQHAWTEVSASNWVTEQPNNPMSHAALASVYTDKNKYIKAIHELQISVRISPQDAALHYYLGMAFHNNGQDDLARYEFYDAVKYDRQDNWPSKESNKMLSGNLSR